MSANRRFVNVAAAGVAFQGGSAAIDSATIVSAFVYQLTGSSILVGTVSAILRVGWLFPQLFVGFLAQRNSSSRRYYIIGAFGRSTCIAVLACLVFIGAEWNPFYLGLTVMVLWTAYAFVSGIVAVPYNDMVARAVPSGLRSRLLATRFFGGGLLALGVAALGDRLLTAYAFPVSYAALFAIAAMLMFFSSAVFVAMGEPPRASATKEIRTFSEYLREGRNVFRADERFRRYVYSQWCSGCVLMAMPFYVVQVSALGFDLTRVAILLGAQTIGGLASNLLWGWWGDSRGKGSLLRGVAAFRIVPPIAVLALTFFPMSGGDWLFFVFAGIFFVLGALASGLTIAVIGYLMEVSPEPLRPAYSGYFNALTAPAYLLPLLGGIIAAFGDIEMVFVISAIAAIAQLGFVNQLLKSVTASSQ